MEIKYKRDIRKSYMCVTSQEKLALFEKNLLAAVRIEGLLPVKIVQEDEKEVYWYDITGAQALDSFLESGQISGEQFLHLMSSLTGLMERLDNFLLKTENLLLVKENIFYSIKGNTFLFCYYPGNTDSRDNFRSLMEYLLTKIDHTDKNAVEMAYHVYEQVARDEAGIMEIQESLRKYRENSNGQIKAAGMEFQGREAPKDLTNTERNKTCEESELYPKQDRVYDISKNKQKVKFFHMNRKNNYQRDICNQNDISQKTDVNTENKKLDTKKWKTEIKWKKIVDKFIHRHFPDIEKLKNYKESRKKKQEIQPVVFEPEPVEIKVGRPTVLLEDRKSSASGIFRYEGTHGLSDMTVGKLPYIIGSAEECEGCIDRETVSRKHARITKVEDIYFIEDMNSANGTKVGGQELAYRTKMSLRPYEIVEFADEKFRFI